MLVFPMRAFNNIAFKINHDLPLIVDDLCTSLLTNCNIESCLKLSLINECCTHAMQCMSLVALNIKDLQKGRHIKTGGRQEVVVNISRSKEGPRVRRSPGEWTKPCPDNLAAHLPLQQEALLLMDSRSRCRDCPQSPLLLAIKSLVPEQES
jgi:hypothetical protein